MASAAKQIIMHYKNSPPADVFKNIRHCDKVRSYQLKHCDENNENVDNLLFNK